MLPVLFNKQCNIQKVVGSLPKVHREFLYHADYLLLKACCTCGNLSGGFVARSKYLVVGFPKGSTVVTCYRSEKKNKSFCLVEGEGRIFWDYLAENTYLRKMKAHILSSKSV